MMKSKPRYEYHIHIQWTERNTCVYKYKYMYSAANKLSIKLAGYHHHARLSMSLKKCSIMELPLAKRKCLRLGNMLQFIREYLPILFNIQSYILKLYGNKNTMNEPTVLNWNNQHFLIFYDIQHMLRYVHTTFSLQLVPRTV